MTEKAKRKAAPTGAAAHQQSKKKKARLGRIYFRGSSEQQTGNSGKWKTPHHQAKAALQQEAGVQPGEAGIWITCARHQESKAAREIGVLFAEYAEKMYGIKEVHDAADEGDGEDDIEAAIRKEVAALNNSKQTGTGTDGAGGHNLTPVKMNVDCLLFVKTKPPIDPVAFVRRICEDARTCADPSQMRCRYVNRLTPVAATGKATEQGLLEVAKAVLGPFFDLSGKRSGAVASEGIAGAVASGQDTANSAADSKAQEAGGDERPASAAEGKAFTFAIRPTIRNHSNLKRDVVINSIAALINDDRHRVNLTSPDKVILVDIYQVVAGTRTPTEYPQLLTLLQAVCGISVVDGDWESLKRFNLTELYSQAKAIRNHE
ncbi:tRNA acetyltransferase TAN1 [Madurella mycetomatis]|uniref:tRNA acetyltransferase TAN1 n=1 Tax=Madurella mycetomatis TaxID=100816 RepID=A0A175W4S6_9PEZI|nr:tRNA acetyltransferase TAN1 [Madurella mycetomatis]